MLVVVGVSHRSAPLSLRERCAVPPDQREPARAALARLAGPAVLLSTCSRTEIFLELPDERATAIAEAVAGWLARRAGPDAGLLTGIETRIGEAALRHLFHVACGLESALEGEDEILGQVRRAWLDAERSGPLPAGLHAAFRIAVRTGRQARRLGSTDGWTSLADVAAAHVSLATGHLDTPRALIAGNGPMGRRAARALRARFGPALDLTLAGRTPDRLAVHAAELDARPIPLTALGEALTRVDAAIVALRAASPLLGPRELAARPAEQPLLIVDLSLPRAVTAEVGAVAGIRLRTVDDLAGAEGCPSRWDAAARAQVQQLIEQALRDHTARSNDGDALTTLTALRMRADAIRRAQLGRTLHRLPDLDEETRWTLEAMTRAIVNRILHEPTLRLRGADGDAAAAQVRQTFELA